VGARDGAKYGDFAIKGGVQFLEKISRILLSFLIFSLYLCILEGYGRKEVPVHPLRRLFPGILSAVYFHHSFFPTRRALCALRSGRTERRKTAGFCPFQLAALCALHSGRTERRKTADFYSFQLAAVCALRCGRTERRKTADFYSFQLAALCAPCVVGARDGAKQQASRGYRYKADARPPGATAFPVRRRRGVPCCRGVYRAAVGCTVPPWVHRAAVGVPCRRGVCPARAPGWKEHQRRPLHSPLVGLDRCFRCLPGGARRVEKAPAQAAYSP